jgi:Fe-S cluster biosynthesis and repair protein YggX
MANNRLRDPAGIPDFNPQIHLNNDAGKLSRLMVATHKYKEIYDMQANRRKATWFNMQKLLVNNYALAILVLRSQHLLKVLTSIAS